MGDDLGLGVDEPTAAVEGMQGQSGGMQRRVERDQSNT